MFEKNKKGFLYKILIMIFLSVFLMTQNIQYIQALDKDYYNNLDSNIKENLKDGIFNNILDIYEEIVVDGRVHKYIQSISFSSKGNQKIIGKEDREMAKKEVKEALPTNQERFSEIANSMDYMLEYVLPGTIMRESSSGRFRNPWNNFGAFQITTAGNKTPCNSYIFPHNISLENGKEIYATPTNICEGTYSLCKVTDDGEQGCYCNNIDYRSQKAKNIDGKNGFDADYFIGMYQDYCGYNDIETNNNNDDNEANFFADVLYSFQLYDYVGFIYHKAGGYSYGSRIVNGMERGRSGSWSLQKLLEVLSGKELNNNAELQKGFNDFFQAYRNYLYEEKTVLADLSNPGLGFTIEREENNISYKELLIRLADFTNINATYLGEIFNSFQLALFHSMYNGAGNVGKHIFDNSYVSNLTQAKAKEIGLGDIYYIFDKMLCDFGACANPFGPDKQPFGALTYTLYYHQKEDFLAFFLLQMFPNLIEKNGFSKLNNYNR